MPESSTGGGAEPVVDAEAGAEPELTGPGPETEGADAELDDSPVDIGAELASLGDGVPPGESVVGGGGGGGGAISETPEAPAPDVASVSPEAGLGQLAGLRPDRTLAALAGLGRAVGRETQASRTAAAADAPTLDLEAGGATPSPTPPPEAPTKAAEAAPEGADSPTPPPPPTPEPSSRPAAEAAAAPAMTGDADGKLSDGDTKKMAASIARMPTRDPDQPIRVGVEPRVPTAGNADPKNVEAQRKGVEKSVSDAEIAARKDAAVKLGEDRIAHARAARALTAQVIPGAPAPAPVIEAQAVEMMDAAGVIAQADSAGEIDAAMAKAQADMATEREKHSQAQQDARANSAKEIETLKSQNAVEQAKEKSAAQTEAEGLRKDWQTEVDQQTADARTKADAEVQAGLKTADDEKKKGEDAAQKAIDDGEKKAADEQAKGEAEADKQKKEGEKDSSGILGWLASKAKSFFSKIKKAISAAIDAARKAVKAAIDAAKEIASAAIEMARKAIVAAIQIVGKALIAISDTLLAAFPGLKEKFRNAIQKRVDQATTAVNALAEKLDKGIQAALDLLGKGLDAALGLLEKGLHMVVDGLSAAVQGAIKAAEGFVNGVLAFAAIIKDVAAAPGQWISNLGAAVVDGIKNHLWSAFQTSVKDWFQAKVLEVIGIGGMVVKLLADNGFDLGKIAGFAWEGLKAAIPAALIQLLVEKLVSMIVPAAGAVKAIIEGLQAAWGTVSRIMTAMSTFVEFLKAVKSGNAGPQFAQALAAAGVVVIDFVANWLLRKLKKAGKKIGKKLKGLFKKKKGKGKVQKNKDSSKDGKLMRKEAKKASRKGWKLAKGKASKRVMKKGALEQAIKGAEGVQRGVKIKTEVQGKGKNWAVKVTASKGSKRATDVHGSGSVLKTKQGTTFYAAADIRPVEKKVETMTRKALDKAVGQDGRDAKGALKSKLSKIKAKGQKQLDVKVKGLDLSLKIESAGGEDGEVTVRALIQPNYYEWTIDVGGGGLEDIKKALSKGRPGRYNEQMGFMQQVADAAQARVSFKPGPKSKPRGSTSHKAFPEYILATFKKGGEKLKVRCNRAPTPVEKGALTDRPLNDSKKADGKGGTAQPHDALSAKDWRDAFRNTSGVMKGPVVAMFTGTSGMAVGDGPSNQPFDSDVHGEKNAVMRLDETAGAGSDDVVATYHAPTDAADAPQVGDVTAAEMRGKDFDGMGAGKTSVQHRTAVLAAMRARANLAMNAACMKVNSKYGSDKNFTDSIDRDFGGQGPAIRAIRDAHKWLEANRVK